MGRNISTFITPRGLSGALFFVIVGFFVLYTQHSRIGNLEMVIEIGTMFILVLAACLWLNRKPALTSERPVRPA